MEENTNNIVNNPEPVNESPRSLNDLNTISTTVEPVQPTETINVTPVEPVTNAPQVEPVVETNVNVPTENPVPTPEPTPVPEVTPAPMTNPENNAVIPVVATIPAEPVAPTEPKYDEVPPAPPKYDEVTVEKPVEETRTDSYFDGKLLELFGWNLLNALITGVTAGIANPWGTCMVLKYTYEHTVINGKRLKFEGNGGNLFVERFKWIFFTIITLGIYGLWIPLKQYKWEISNVHFADEEFVKGESFFDGKLLQCIGINLVTKILNTISFGLLFTFTICLKLKWQAKHTIINRKKIIFEGNALNQLGKYLLWFFLTIITFGIFGLWLSLKMKQWEVKNTRLKLVDEEEKKDYVTPAVLVGGLIFIVPFIILLVKVIIPSVSNGGFNLGKLGKAEASNSGINYPQEYYNDYYQNENYE